jgi:hypothetical protein
METFDFTSPSYYTSGLQAVIARHMYERPSMWVVLAALFGTIDAKAQLIGIILVFSVVVFGHCIALAENFFSTFNEENCDIRNNYFEGTQDGMWFSLVVMSTVAPRPKFRGLLRPALCCDITLQQPPSKRAGGGGGRQPRPAQAGPSRP